MTYEEWKKYKVEQEKKRTHNAEKVDIYDELYDIEFAIRDTCFKSGEIFQLIPLYYIPADLEEKHADSAGLYGYGCIMISKPYYEKYGAGDKVINTLHHEMLHAFCDLNNIEDTDGEKHLEAFADACEEHGGRCTWENSEYGYSNTFLTTKAMKRVKKALQEKKGAK